MDSIKILIVASIGILTIVRLILNIIIYRSEYEYSEHTDGTALDFGEEEVNKRDSTVVLWVLSLFTFYWRTVRTKNKRNAFISNLLSISSFGLVLVFWLTGH